jgi:hypothetical protein
MKEFEKWCDEIEFLCVDYSKRDSMRRAWRAALKWSLTQETDLQATEIAWAIEKELEDENIQGQERWCEKCRAKIEAAKNLECVRICHACAKRNLR